MPQTISLLCIDDNPLFLDAFRARLEQEKDLDVTTASTSAEALDLLNRQYFDVIISDYAMPDMDGLALFKEIRARGGQSIFIIATAKRLAHIARDALNTGVDYYLQKGADIKNEFPRLIDFIRTRVSQKNAEHELKTQTRFYNSIVHNGAEFICRIKPDGTFSFINEPCVNLYKKPSQQLLRENFYSYVPDSERNEILACLQALSPEKPDCLLLHHVIAGDGRSVLLYWGYHGLFSPSGVIQEYQLTGRDSGTLVRIGTTGTGGEHGKPSAVTGSSPKTMEEKPGKGSDLMAMLQSLDVPFFAVDKFGVIIAWSAKLAELTDVAATEMIGKGNREYAVPFYGKPGPMLVDHVVCSPGSTGDNNLPAAKKTGDTFIGEKEHVAIRGKPMILIGKCIPVHNASGHLIAAIESIAVSETQAETAGAELNSGIVRPLMEEDAEFEGIWDFHQKILVGDPSGSIPLDIMYDTFVQFCCKNGRKPVDKDAFEYLLPQMDAPHPVVFRGKWQGCRFR